MIIHTKEKNLHLKIKKKITSIEAENIDVNKIYSSVDELPEHYRALPSADELRKLM